MPLRWIVKGALPIIILLLSGLLSRLPAETTTTEELLRQDKALISHPSPDPRGGKSYKLTYLVKLPLEIYWRFKTDFDNDFLLTNKYIEVHRLIRRSGQVVITENQYANSPGKVFRWQTVLSPHRHRLDYMLLNPERCGHQFHYGVIQLKAQGAYTRVTQEAYFDFLGATLWVLYPWSGGMTSFLLYTARWEQETALRLQQNYRQAP